MKFSTTDGIATIFRTNGFKTVSSKRVFITLLIGFIFGFCLANILIILPNSENFYKIHIPAQINNKLEVFQNHSENTTLATKLYNDVKVLCWILTGPKYHNSRAIHVKRTWGQRCNKLIFISSENDTKLGAIGFNVTEGHDFLWEKTMAAFKYIHENYLNEYDWFLKADDDTYVIMENLRLMLSEHRSDLPLYFGCKFQVPAVVYMSGGAGYVLSKESVKRLVEVAFKNPQICSDEAIAEDLMLGACLQGVNVIPGDTRDKKRKTRFHSLNFHTHLQSDSLDKIFWLRSYSYYKFKTGYEHMSNRAISFHYLKPVHMYMSEYLIYHVKPYGIWQLPEDIPKEKLTGDEELQRLKLAEADRNLNF